MTTPVRVRLDVAGVVQGVGFRPFVHAVAADLGLVGFVRNEVTHVHIEVQGPAGSIERFEQRIRRDTPPMARVDSIDIGELPCRADRAFRISPSGNRHRAQPSTLIPPDAAVCADCVDELFDVADRRYRHPFITCTNCGPRFTIITAMPYDRPNTTMGQFQLCDACAAEYINPSDRRHHAQPIACNNCGPTLRYEGNARAINGTDDVLAQVFTDIDAGLTVAIKGIGGYHLAVDATNSSAVQRLRARKARPDKPFAVMVTDIDIARQLAHIDDAEASVLASPSRPIVLLRARERTPVASEVAPGNPLIGIMLPYAPLHHLLFRPVPDVSALPPTVLVMTSGNVANEPICFDDEDARSRLAPLADSFCLHNRPIHAPCDDSVIRLVGGTPFPLRRSRGYAPLPVQLPTKVPNTLAVGGEIKNTFALAAGRTAWISQHLGDMENLETNLAFEASVRLFTELYDVQPEVLAVDAHPRYRTRRWARDHAEGRPVVEVQHHHAHLAALLAEHQIDPSRQALAFVFDGTGYGIDGGSWGGEVLTGSYDAAQRWGSLRPIPLPGGDSAVLNPCRTALAHLAAAGIEWAQDLPPVSACETTELDVLRRQLDSGSGCTTTTSMGRLFDAVASLLGLRHRITYEAQAAIELEVLATEATTSGSPMQFTIDSEGLIDPEPVLSGVVDGLRGGEHVGALARSFHVAVVEAMLTCADRIQRAEALELVGLTGGVFQNVLLARLAIDGLEAKGFEVLTHRHVPPNDGGLALGQVMVAAHHQQRRSQPCV